MLALMRLGAYSLDYKSDIMIIIFCSLVAHRFPFFCHLPNSCLCESFVFLVKRPVFNLLFSICKRNNYIPDTHTYTQTYKHMHSFIV